MDDHEKSKLHSNMIWFNNFFSGIKQLFDSVYDSLPREFFSPDFELKSGNYYYPRQNYSPSIPSHYVLMVPGRNWALQLFLIVDEELIAKGSGFSPEPSLFVVLHSQVDRYGYVDYYGLKIIKNSPSLIEVTKQEHSIIKGKVDSKIPADFFAFQVLLDEFSEGLEPNTVIREKIVNPIMELSAE